jgi:hypothetical protein
MTGDGENVTPMPGPLTRQCPVCGTRFPVKAGRGRPRVYCGDECRWAAGREAVSVSGGQVSERTAREIGEWLDRDRDVTGEELVAWMEGGFGPPPD